MTIRPTLRRVVLTLPDTTINPSTIPLTPPAPEDRLSPGDCDSALRQGMVPLSVQQGWLVPLSPPEQLLARLGADYLAQLLHDVSQGKLPTGSPVEDRLIWGYLRRAAEYEAREELRTLSTLYRKAASATDNLRHKLEADGRLYEGIPLPVAQERTQAAYDAHWTAIEAARQAAKMIASASLDTLVWMEWLDWLHEKGAWEVVGEAKAATQWRYRPDRLSIADLEHLAHVFHRVGDLAHWLVSTGTVAAMKRPATGGRPIDYPMRWLIQQAHQNGIDAAALGELVYARQNDIPDFKGIAKENTKKRISVEWRRMAKSDHSLRTPPVAHNL